MERFPILEVLCVVNECFVPECVLIGYTEPDQPVPHHQSLFVRKGSTLALGTIEGPGVRSYLAVAGGLNVPVYLGSRSTFPDGQLGGVQGRALRTGDLVDTPDITTTGVRPDEVVPVAVTFAALRSTSLCCSAVGSPNAT